MPVARRWRLQNGRRPPIVSGLMANLAALLLDRRAGPEAQERDMDVDGMHVDRKALIDSLGGEHKFAGMSHEARADALEDFQTQALDKAVAAKARPAARAAAKTAARRAMRPIPCFSSVNILLASKARPTNAKWRPTGRHLAFGREAG